MSEGLTPHYIYRPDCEHIQVIHTNPSISIADYSQRLISELQEAVKQPCEQCAKQRVKQDLEKDQAERVKQKLMQEMRKR